MVVALIIAAAVFAGCGTFDITDSTCPDISGTVWGGADSDGDYYEYWFMKGGPLHYQSPTGFWKNGAWKQKGCRIYMEINNRYSERKGTIRDNTMEGGAWNIKKHKWTWRAEYLRTVQR